MSYFHYTDPNAVLLGLAIAIGCMSMVADQLFILFKRRSHDQRSRAFTKGERR